MGEYFRSKEEAVKFLKKYKTIPAFFGKILDYGITKWMIDYKRENPDIEILENLTEEARTIISQEKDNT